MSTAKSHAGAAPVPASGGWFWPTPGGRLVPAQPPPSNPPSATAALMQQAVNQIVNGLGEDIADAISKEGMALFEKIKNKLKARFPQPIPEEISIYHHKCGGRVSIANWNGPDRMECEHGVYSDDKLNKIGGCGGVWLQKVLEEATDEDLRKWFWPRDEGSYVLKEQNKPQDDYGNKQPRAYSYLVKKE